MLEFVGPSKRRCPAAIAAGLLFSPISIVEGRRKFSAKKQALDELVAGAAGADSLAAAQNVDKRALRLQIRQLGCAECRV